MASPREGAGEGTGSLGDRRQYIEVSSDSERSFYGESVRRAVSDICRWRTARFNDQECSRFFDCPSHMVERHLSDDEVEHADVVAEAVAVSPQLGASPLSREAGHRRTTRDTAIAPSDRSSPVNDDDAPATSRAEAQGRRWGLPHEANVEIASSQMDDGLQRRNSARAADSRTSVFDLTDDSPSRRTARTGRRPTGGGVNEREIDNSQQTEDSEGVSEFILPRWQPDAEATFCPICRTQFSFFIRKHHCRKCGRVVCNGCSPHRITIPHQFIVRPPDQLGTSDQRRTLSLVARESGFADIDSLGGGERVRLCNPCVPDPNPSPPGPQRSRNQTSPRRPHYRSRSNAVDGLGSVAPSSQVPAYFPQEYYSTRNRSVTHSGSIVGVAGSSRGTRRRVNSGGVSAFSPSPSSAYPGTASSHPRNRSMLDPGSSSSSARDRALPPAPQIAEEDECPVCHRELPSRNLPDFESLRETHITDCISAHSTRSSSGTAMAESAGGTSFRAQRRTGMFPYVATEKDCVDAAECTICLEEFEVGVPMARLECLCRFHKACISAWFVKNPGCCPVHQHDHFGY